MPYPIFYYLINYTEKYYLLLGLIKFLVVFFYCFEREQKKLETINSFEHEKFDSKKIIQIILLKMFG